MTLIAKQVYPGKLMPAKRKMFKKLIGKELDAVLANVVVDYRERDNPVITPPEELKDSTL